MNQLMNGAADCAPQNDLKSITNRLQIDRGALQDRTGNAIAGPSRQQPFRNLPSSQGVSLGASRSSQADPSTGTSRPFNLSELQNALRPETRSPVNHHSAQWSSDYQRHHVVGGQSSPGLEAQWRANQRQSPAAGNSQMAEGWRQSFLQSSQTSTHSIPSRQSPLHQQSAPSLQGVPQYGPSFRAPMPQYHMQSPQPQFQQPFNPSQDPSLAETARMILLQQSQLNQQSGVAPEFESSEFMNLMQGLADGQVELDDQAGAFRGAAGSDASANADWAKSFIPRFSSVASSHVQDERISGDQEFIKDAYMPSVAMPRFNPDGSLLSNIPRVRFDTPQDSMTPPHGVESEAQWSQMFDNIPQTHTGLSNRDAYSMPVPNTLEEALQPSARAEANVPGAGMEWEEDFDEAGFAGFYGRTWTGDVGGVNMGMRQRGSEMLLTPSPERQAQYAGESSLKSVESLQMRYHNVSSQQEQQGMEASMEQLDRVENEVLRGEMGHGYGYGSNIGRLGDKAAQGRYLFQRSNPYVEGMKREVGSGVGWDQSDYMNVLESEAAVLAHPEDSQAWFNLGIKQQENERDDQAIPAFLQCIRLDPSHRESYLALAVSYCNDGNLHLAHNVLETWIDLVEGRQSRGGAATKIDATLHNERQRLGKEERQELLVDNLVDLARRGLADGRVDADVQVALGVLFNANEDFEKAQDCFRSALDVRPDDWMLYNRLGATLANGGKSGEALDYYQGALDLHPGYVRAMFNIGISLIKLARYREAARHILDAIRLQHSDATEGYSSSSGGSSGSRGVTSDVLWQTLRTACMNMNRHDLTDLCMKKDLNAFHNEEFP